MIGILGISHIHDFKMINIINHNLKKLKPW